MVKIGLSLDISSGRYCRIARRSGLALKESIDIEAGVIDSDYMGKLEVIVLNFSDTGF